MPSNSESLTKLNTAPHGDDNLIESTGISVKENNPMIAAIDAVQKRRDREKRVLLGALIFCFIFMVTEFVFGVIAHSLALITDAVHLFTDVGAYALSIGALLAAGKLASRKYNYGWSRAEVIGTLISVISIWALVIWIVSEAIDRIYDIVMCSRVPAQYKKLHESGEILSYNDIRSCREIKSPLMLIVGGIGLLVNMICALILYIGGTHGHSHGGGGHGHSHGGGSNKEHDHGHEHSHDHRHEHSHDHGHEHSHDHGHEHEHSHEDEHGHENEQNGSKKKQKIGFALNAALLHALGDCMQSIGVILAGLYIFLANKYTYGVPSYKYTLHNLADPISSIFFAVITLKMTMKLLFDIVNILMESTPRGIDYDILKNELLNIEGVHSVHDLHVWALSADNISLSAHLIVNETDGVLKKAKKLCLDRFGIFHTTIQLDSVESGNQKCEGSCH